MSEVRYESNGDASVLILDGVNVAPLVNEVVIHQVGGEPPAVYLKKGGDEVSPEMQAVLDKAGVHLA